MGYVDENLLPAERVIHRGELHWAIFLPGIILLPLYGLGLIFLVVAGIRKATTELAVTNRRVIIKTGWISRKTIEMILAKVEHIGVEQSVMGRLLGYGTVTVVGTGGTRELFKTVAAPLEFRRAVQAQLHGSGGAQAR